jgi:hypothetical protein
MIQFDSIVKMSQRCSEEHGVWIFYCTRLVKIPVKNGSTSPSVESTQGVLITRTCYLLWEFSYVVPVPVLSQITLLGHMGCLVDTLVEGSKNPEWV